MRWVLLGAPVGQVEALGSHLSPNATILHLQDQPTKCCICQIKVPHIFESTLINLTDSSRIGTANWSTERIASMCCSWHLLDYAKRVVEQILLSFFLLGG